MACTPPDKRFRFGKNWKRFRSLIHNERIEEAEKSLRHMLACDQLNGKDFLDIGCGSGLFSLAARRLGARVCSFDFDRDSVECTQDLKEHFARNDEQWRICRGSVLDRAFISSLGSYDIVYAWGVLHHTGNMLTAMDHAALPVKAGGIVFVALYNDQGAVSRIWHLIKRTYCSGMAGRVITSSFFFPGIIMACFIKDICTLHNPLGRYREYKNKRGMSILYDWIDWLGGYPFETARPEDVVSFYQQRKFRLEKEVLTRGWGNNQFVFRKGEP